MESHILVIYDIEEDPLRNKISETCKDYGLERIQYSAFMGKLSSNKRQEFFLKVSHLMGKKTGKIIVLPVCERDYKERREKINAGKKDE